MNAAGGHKLESVSSQRESLKQRCTSFSNVGWVLQMLKAVHCACTKYKKGGEKKQREFDAPVGPRGPARTHRRG